MKRTMLVFVVFGMLVPLLINCTGNPKPDSSGKEALNNEQLVERGNYLVTTMGCNDCHSPKRMGERGVEIIPELMLSGYPADRPLGHVDTSVLHKGWVLFHPDLTAAVGPWGVSFAGNITSDASGIGNWTEENFIRAMKEGKFKGLEATRTLLPPMPWENFAKMDDDDIRAIFAYLKSTNPVRNVVPAPIAPNEIR
jgi:hypothetical protein